MGKKAKEEGDDKAESTSVAAASIDPDVRRNVRAVNHSLTRTKNESLDIAGLGNAFGAAHERGAASASKQIDLLEHALKSAHDTIERKDAALEKKDVKIEQLIGQLAKLAEANVTQQLIEGKARLDETNAREMHESVRVAIKTFGPASVPLLQRAASILMPNVGDIADKGDKSPRSCAIRVFARLQDGSEVSTRLFAILADFADDDLPGLMAYLSEIANTPASANESAH